MSFQRRLSGPRWRFGGETATVTTGLAWGARELIDEALGRFDEDEQQIDWLTEPAGLGDRQPASQPAAPKGALGPCPSSPQAGPPRGDCRNAAVAETSRPRGAVAVALATFALGRRGAQLIAPSRNLPLDARRPRLASCSQSAPGAPRPSPGRQQQWAAVQRTANNWTTGGRIDVKQSEGAKHVLCAAESAAKAAGPLWPPRGER